MSGEGGFTFLSGAYPRLVIGCPDLLVCWVLIWSGALAWTLVFGSLVSVLTLSRKLICVSMSGPVVTLWRGPYGLDPIAVSSSTGNGTVYVFLFELWDGDIFGFRRCPF